MSKVALITGVSGGIGQALAGKFLEAGYRIIGLDISKPKSTLFAYVYVDLDIFSKDGKYRKRIVSEIRRHLPNGELNVLINNAALQILCDTNSFKAEDWQQTLNVNLTAPFLLVQSFLPELIAAKGNVINISSIHAQLTKPGFVAYATSKAALSGLTKALAVDIGEHVRVNAISPAAIETEMLRAGFERNVEGYDRLVSHHPSKVIGAPSDVADIALMLATTGAFLNGSIIGLDGAISSRLHDPN